MTLTDSCSLIDSCPSDCELIKAIFAEVDACYKRCPLFVLEAVEPKKITVLPEFFEWFSHVEIKKHQTIAELQKKVSERWAGVIAKATECYVSLPEDVETWTIDKKTDSAVKETVFPPVRRDGHDAGRGEAPGPPFNRLRNRRGNAAYHRCPAGLDAVKAGVG